MSLAEKTKTIAENVPKVFEAGKQVGKQVEYDRFWDSYQDYGNRTHYGYGFAGDGWNNDTFKPKYNICPSTASAIFYSVEIEGDFVELLSAFGITLDLSKATNLSSAFASSSFITRLGVVNTSNATTIATMFSACYGLVTIDKLILKSDGSQTITNLFSQCNALENVTIEGVIGSNIDVHWSTKLTRDSLMSIINALQDKSGTTGSWVCTLGTENIAKLTDAEKAIATQKGWTLL